MRGFRITYPGSVGGRGRRAVTFTVTVASSAASRRVLLVESHAGPIISDCSLLLVHQSRRAARAWGLGSAKAWGPGRARRSPVRTWESFTQPRNFHTVSVQAIPSLLV